ncbi:MAG: hypothetical protein LBN10_05190 [Propionibacteriaceae bacterium]|jgi:hypothetical protein|nr:hypothetical protein [Propionibacteriaceae bacterium]
MSDIEDKITIAKHIVWNAVDQYFIMGISWGADYPDIGEYDFEDIERIARALVNPPAVAMYQAAYTYLKEKAELWAAELPDGVSAS